MSFFSNKPGRVTKRVILSGAIISSSLMMIVSPGYSASTVTINELSGFTDTTPATPIGGNNGTTVGQQRSNVFRAAGDWWQAKLNSTVPILVDVNFAPLTCSVSSGILGSAGPLAVYRDFSGAPRASTWYVVAQTNALVGSDVDADNSDIAANFNSSLGTAECLPSLSWYYGLDENPGDGQIDLYQVVLHEMGHGLGFLSLVAQAGTKFYGYDDAFMVNLEEHISGKNYPAMTDTERESANIATGNLHWTGTSAIGAATGFSAGVVANHPTMYAPDPYESGSSVSHWNTTMTPNELMEPSYTGAAPSSALTLTALRDMGWSVNAPGVHSDYTADGKADILWRNSSSGLTWLHTMDGATVTASARATAIGTGWQLAGQGDYNGDGKADLLWRNTTTGVNWMSLMDGSQVLASQGVSKIVDQNWQIAGDGDYNGDGKADILWRHATTGINWVYFMNGATVTQSQAATTIRDLNWKIAGNGDYNGDGKADILWRHATSGVNWMFLMDGATATSSQRVSVISDLDWKVVGSGDHDGDGKADIFWRHATSGANWLYLMNGATVSMSDRVGDSIVDTNWQVAGSTDYDGDGKADILWHHATSGINWMYLLNGHTVTNSLRAGRVSDTTWDVVNVP